MPYNVEAPWLIETTATTVHVRWSKPEEGGCPIQSYAIYSDLGNIVAGFLNNLDSVNVEDRPQKFQHTFTFASSLTGQLIRFKLKATNELGSTTSDSYLEVLLTGKPTAPSTSITKVLSTADLLVVEMPQISTAAGSLIQAYELQIDDGLQGDLVTVYVGLNRTVTLPTNLGLTYRLRYRVQNTLGWSDFSQITYLLAAWSPNKPSVKPQLVSVDATHITISLTSCGISNGALITDYVLYIQEGAVG